MKARAAIFLAEREPFSVEDIEVDDPKEDEVLVKVIASGLCHSDYHLITGEYGSIRWPLIVGHEGAGIVAEVGPHVKNVKKGDHVLLSFLPACGHCAYCAMGKSPYCELGAKTLGGKQLDGTFRARRQDGKYVGQFGLIGTFANWSVVPAVSCLPLHPAIPLDKICLMGCCVPTGFGSAVKSAGTRTGEVVVVYGIGGIGANALQGAAAAGARMIIAVDPVPFKREMAMKFGATHALDTGEGLLEKILELTYNRGADRAVVTIGNPTPEDIGLAFRSVRKCGRLVITGVTNTQIHTMPISPFEVTFTGKEIVGSLFGDATTHEDIPRLLEMYSAGKLKVDELVTRTYPLERINEGYQDMLDGKNIRGVVVHEH